MGGLILGSLFMFGALMGLFENSNDNEEEPEPDEEELFGTEGDDLMSANGAMTLNAGAGADEVSASGAATVNGGEDDDLIYIGQDGDAGAAALHGGAGNDFLLNYLEGVNGESTLYGGAGDDYLFDFHPGDQLYGGDGSDHLTGADGISMTGGAGNDIFDLWANQMPPEGEATVITDFVAGEDEIAIFMPPGEWLDTMQVTTEVVNGSTVVSFAFDHTAEAFPEGYDNVALGNNAPEDFSFVLQGVTQFDAASIKLTSGSGGGNPALRPLEDFDVLHGTSGDDLIDVYSPEYAHNYLFSGDGADTVVGGLWTKVSGGSGDDVVIHRLIADPAVDLPFEEQIFAGNTQTFGGAGNDLIVLEDDFVESFYGFDTHEIGGFEVGGDQLGLIIPQSDAQAVEVTYGIQDDSDFVTATVTTPDGELTIVLLGVYEAPAGGAFQLYEDEAAVLAGNSYGTALVGAAA